MRPHSSQFSTRFPLRRMRSASIAGMASGHPSTALPHQTDHGRAAERLAELGVPGHGVSSRQRQVLGAGSLGHGQVRGQTRLGLSSGHRQRPGFDLERLARCRQPGRRLGERLQLKHHLEGGIVQVRGPPAQHGDLVLQRLQFLHRVDRARVELLPRRWPCPESGSPRPRTASVRPRSCVGAPPPRRLRGRARRSRRVCVERLPFDEVGHAMTQGADGVVIRLHGEKCVKTWIEIGINQQITPGNRDGHSASELANRPRSRVQNGSKQPTPSGGSRRRRPPLRYGPLIAR